MAAAQTPENNGDDRDLIFMMRLTYIGFNVDPLTKFSSSSSRSIELKDIFSWNISQIITKAIAVRTRLVISCTMEWGIPF